MSFLSQWAFGTDLDQEQARGNDADAKLAELNRKALDKGLYTQSQFDKAEQDRIAGSIPNVSSSVTWAGVKGATELVTDPDQWGSDLSKGAGVVADFGDNATLAAGNAIQNSTNKLFGRLVPWQAWVILALVGIFWLGKRFK